MDIEAWNGEGTLPPLYCKSATGAVQIWLCWIHEDSVVVQWGQKDGAQQQAQYKCEPKNVGRANATDGHEQARLEAISKWKKQLKKKYVMTVEATEDFRIRPMLAETYQDFATSVKWPAHVQPKFNGVRCLAYRKDGFVVLQSRGNDLYDVEHIRKELEPVLPAGIMLDGELYAHGVSLQTILSWVRNSDKPERARLTYNVYDLAWLEGGNRIAPSTQRKRARDLWFSNNANKLSSVQYVHTWEVLGEIELFALYEQLVNAGYEGAIVRLFDGTYRFGPRSRELLKYKRFQDQEFTIVGFKTGKGKAANTPIFCCKTEDGKEFDATMEGTDEERLEMLQNAPNVIGQQLTVRFFDWTDDGKPHHGHGVAIRPPGT